ncbi:hypothetical protein GCM10027067_11580 [Pseudactinotalea suaedae]
MAGPEDSSGHLEDLDEGASEIRADEVTRTAQASRRWVAVGGAQRPKRGGSAGPAPPLGCGQGVRGATSARTENVTST